MMSTSTEIYNAVSSHYSAASAGRTKSGTYESTVATAFGYTPAELSSIPQDANLGLSCGNPHVLAKLREGEVVVDLGSGAGFDIFLAAPKVGPTGQAIGVDMNKDMLAKAERNKKSLKDGGANVRFVEAPITDIKPLESASVDCIISNCVVNLVPEEDKPLVFNEMYRLLKPGGRVAIADTLIKDGKQLPKNLKRDMGLYVGCIAGASLVSDYEKYLKDAGFESVLIVGNGTDLNVYNSARTEGEEAKSCCVTGVSTESAKSCCGTSLPVQEVGTKSCCGTSTQTQTNGGEPSTINVDMTSVDFNAYAGSYNIYAVKA